MKITTVIKSIVFSLVLVFTASCFAENSPINAISDTAITGVIKTKIAMDKTLSNSEVEVTTNQGVVTIKGQVKTDSEADAVIEMAQSISGVKDVDANDLKVADSKHPFEDTVITAKIKGLFLQEKLFGNADVAAMTISVTTNNGIVSLTGTADNQAQADNAVKIAKSVKGVRNVESRIEVTK